MKTVTLSEIENNFEEVKGQEIKFIVPQYESGHLLELGKQTIGFRRYRTGYFTTLEFNDHCLFCKLKESNFGGITLSVIPQEMTKENGETKSLQLKVLGIPNNQTTIEEKIEEKTVEKTKNKFSFLKLIGVAK